MHVCCLFPNEKHHLNGSLLVEATQLTSFKPMTSVLLGETKNAAKKNPTKTTLKLWFAEDAQPGGQHGHSSAAPFWTDLGSGGFHRSESRWEIT